MTPSAFFRIIEDMWNYFEPEATRWYRWRLDGASAYVRKDGDEWRTVFLPSRFQDSTDDSGGPEAGSPPPDAASSFAVAHGGTVALRPRFGERPYLILARNEVRIMAGAEARFELALPALLRFELESGAVLGEAMPFLLSNTWFGDKTGGSLCWSLPTALDPRCAGESADSADALGAAGKDRRSLVHSSIVVRNGSKAPMELKRLAVYTDLLNIYETADGLATDPISVDGLADGGLRMSVAEATLSDGRRLISPARIGQREMLVRRGVNFLRAVTGM